MTKEKAKKNHFRIALQTCSLRVCGDARAVGHLYSSEFSVIFYSQKSHAILVLLFFFSCKAMFHKSFGRIQI